MILKFLALVFITLLIQTFSQILTRALHLKLPHSKHTRNKLIFMSCSIYLSRPSWSSQGHL